MNTTQQSNSQKTALITGASGGIGYELAKLFASDRYNLVLIARSEQKLKEIAYNFNTQFGINVKIIVKDLSLPNAPEEIFQELQQEGIKINVLVNNAGFGGYGFFAETDLTKERQMMQLNIVALTYLTKLFLKDMIAQKEGKILNLGSTAAFQPGPLMAVYYASKAYVLSFSEALSNELKNTGVTVTVLCPGPTETGFESAANLGESRLFKQQIMDAPTVAKIGYQGLMNGETIVIPGLKNKLLAGLVRFIPRNAVTNIVRTMQEKG